MVQIDTFQLVLVAAAGLIAFLNGVTLFWMRTNHLERKEDRERLIRIETRLEGLDMIRNDVQGNRHKIASLDKGLADVLKDVSILKDKYAELLSKFNHRHGED